MQNTFNFLQKKKILFPLSVAFMLLAWFPYFLAYYPGILSCDSYIQIGQIISGDYNNHHPVFHTLFIRACLWIGGLFSCEINTGIVVYCILQSLIMSTVMAYGIWLITKRGRIWIAIIAQLICMFFPFNGFMAVTITKDVIFTSFTLLMLLSLYEKMIVAGKERRSNVLFILGSIGLILFRNNGRYAYIVMIIIAFLLFLVNRKSGVRKTYLNLLVFSVASLIVGMVFLTTANKALSAQDGDKREMLSVPIQQFARVAYYHENELDEESFAFINNFLLFESYKLYDPYISDPVKRNTNTNAILVNPKRFVRIYFKLFKAYPKEYLDAFLDLYKGYYDILDTSHAYINVVEGETGLGYVQTRWEIISLSSYGFYKDSKLPALYEKLEKWADNNSYLNIQILRFVFAPGIYLWLCLAMLILILIRKKFYYLLPFSFIFGYYITLFLGPTVQLRYIYPVMIFVLFAICLGDFLKNEKSAK